MEAAETSLVILDRGIRQLEVRIAEQEARIVDLKQAGNTQGLIAAMSVLLVMKDHLRLFRDDRDDELAWLTEEGTRAPSVPSMCPEDPSVRCP
jgi:uncharacterized coiled-coil protein SlyX